MVYGNMLIGILTGVDASVCDADNQEKDFTDVSEFTDFLDSAMTGSNVNLHARVQWYLTSRGPENPNRVATKNIAKFWFFFIKVFINTILLSVLNIISCKYTRYPNYFYPLIKQKKLKKSSFYYIEGVAVEFILLVTLDSDSA